MRTACFFAVCRGRALAGKRIFNLPGNTGQNNGHRRVYQNRVLGTGSSSCLYLTLKRHMESAFGTLSVRLNATRVCGMKKPTVEKFHSRFLMQLNVQGL